MIDLFEHNPLFCKFSENNSPTLQRFKHLSACEGLIMVWKKMNSYSVNLDEKVKVFNK